MSVKVYALPFQEISGQIKNVGQVSSLEVSVRNIKLGRLTQRAVVNFDAAHGKRVFAVPFVVPESFEVSDGNWPELFRMERIRSRNYEPIVAPFRENDVFPTSVVWNNRKIPICVVTMKDGWKYAVYIIDRSDPFYLSLKVKNVTFIRKTDNISREISFTSKNLRMSHSDENGNTHYILPFKSEKSPEEMLRRWLLRDGEIDSNPDNFDLTDSSKYGQRVHSFYGFHYFSAFGGKVIFTLQKNPVILAMSAFSQHVRKMVDDNSVLNTIDQLHCDFDSILASDDPNKTALFLQNVVNIHKSISTF